MLEMLEMLEMLRSSDGAVLFRDCPVVPWSKLARRSPAASPASRGMVHNALPSRGGRGRSVSLQNTVFIAVAQAGTHNATKPGITGELCGLGRPRGKHTDGTMDFSLGAAVRPERPLLSADPYLHLPTGSFGVPGASKRRAAAPAACPAARRGRDSYARNRTPCALAGGPRCRFLLRTAREEQRGPTLCSARARDRAPRRAPREAWACRGRVRR